MKVPEEVTDSTTTSRGVDNHFLNIDLIAPVETHRTQIQTEEEGELANLTAPLFNIQLGQNE